MEVHNLSPRCAFGFSHTQYDDDDAVLCNFFQNESVR